MSYFHDLKTSEIYWLAWILLGFLVPELLAHFGVIPMMTLSRTSWDEESRFPILRVILFGFLTGLVFHIVFRTSLWETLLGSTAFAFIAHFGWALRKRI